VPSVLQQSVFVLVFSLHGILLRCMFLMQINVYLLFDMSAAYLVCSVDAMSV
jgi:hypothetical protein